MLRSYPVARLSTPRQHPVFFWSGIRPGRLSSAICRPIPYPNHNSNSTLPRPRTGAWAGWQGSGESWWKPADCPKKGRLRVIVSRGKNKVRLPGHGSGRNRVGISGGRGKCLQSGSFASRNSYHSALVRGLITGERLHYRSPSRAKAPGSGPAERRAAHRPSGSPKRQRFRVARGHADGGRHGVFVGWAVAGAGQQRPKTQGQPTRLAALSAII